MSGVERRLLEPPTLQDPIVGQRSPFEIYMLAIGIILGITQAFGNSISRAFSEVVGHEVSIIWGVILATGCIVALFGVLYSKNPYIGLLAERSGVVLVGGASLTYAAIILAFSTDSTTAYAIGVNAAFGLASLWRAFQITRRFRWMHKYGTERRGIMSDRLTAADVHRDQLDGRIEDTERRRN